MPPYVHIYLSPHLDDAVLSCGGRLWQQAQAGERVLVVTVFASGPAPGGSLSPFAQELHARWEASAREPARRQEEDLAALAVLGGEVAHWPYADCIYRQTPAGTFPYAREESLWGAIHPAEERLIAELAARIGALPLAEEGAVYAPLGVRRHVDHQVVRRAAEICRCRLVYYEDYPYAENPAWLREALATLEGSEAELALLSEEALAAKVAAIACYRSQFNTFWASLDEMADSVRAYAERVGEGLLAERYWSYFWSKDTPNQGLCTLFVGRNAVPPISGG